MSPLAFVLVSIWFSAATGSAFTKDWLPFLAALIATLAIGCGYLMMNGAGGV